MNDERLYLLEKAPVSKGVVRMAIPSIIGMLVMAIYNIVDTMFVAWLGTEATGATQVVFPLVMIFGAVGLSYGIGGGSYVSRLLGEKRKEDAYKVLSTCFFLALGSGLLLTGLGLAFLEPILKMFGATETIMPLAKEYAFFIVLGGGAQVLNMTFNNMLRSEGSAKNSMIGMAAGAILNIILDPIFIFGLGLGIKGAAIATSLSQLVTTLILLYQYLAKKSILTLSIRYFSLSKELLTEVFKMGAPSFSRQVLTSVAMALMNSSAAFYGGDVGLAAVGIVSRTMMIVMYIIFGLSQGFQPVAGYNFGAKSYGRLKQALGFTAMLSMSITIAFGMVFLVFDDQILSIFKPTVEVMVIAKEFLVYFVASMVMMSFTNVLGTYYQAVGRGTPALILSVARQGIFFIPLILTLPNILGLQGVFLAQLVADGLTLLLSLAFFVPTSKELNQAIHSVA